MRTHILSTLSLSIILGLSACNESEIEIDEKVLYTYKGNYRSSKTQLFLITDSTGLLIDSAPMTHSGLVELSGPSNIERFTFTRITKDRTYTSISSYCDIKPGRWDGSITPSASDGSSDSEVFVNLKISKEFATNFHSSIELKGRSKINNKSLSLDEPFYSSTENKISACWHRYNQAPKFTMYTNLISGSDLEVNPEDFSDMTVHNVISDNEFMYVSSLNGKQHINSESSYNLADFPFKSNKIYYPPGQFNYYISTFRYFQEMPNETSQTIHYGQLPNTVEKIDIGKLSIPTSIDNFESGSTNQNITLLKHKFSNMESSYHITCPNINKDFHINKIIDLVREMVPDNTITLDRWDNSWIYEIEGINYDQYIIDLQTPNVEPIRTIVKEYIRHPSK